MTTPKKRWSKTPKLGRQPDGSYRFEVTPVNVLALFDVLRKRGISTGEANAMLDEAIERYERRQERKG